MNALDRAGERQRGFRLAAAGFGRGEAENRAEPFPTGEKAVTHRLVDGRGVRGFVRQESAERAADFLLPGGEIRLQFHRCGLWELLREFANPNFPNDERAGVTCL